MIQDVPMKKKSVDKIQRWNEKLFNALLDPKENVVNERFIEAKLFFISTHGYS